MNLGGLLSEDLDGLVMAYTFMLMAGRNGYWVLFPLRLPTLIIL